MAFWPGFEIHEIVTVVKLVPLKKETYRWKILECLSIHLLTDEMLWQTSFLLWKKTSKEINLIINNYPSDNV